MKKIIPNLSIKSINPGYTVNGIRDVGEFIELQNATNAPLSLAGYLLRYVNSSGKQTTLAHFSEGSSVVGEFLLLRLARTANSAEAELTYTTTLAATNSRIELLYDGKIVDQVCWGKYAPLVEADSTPVSKNDSESAPTCVENFDTKHPTILARDADSGNFEHLPEYLTHYDATNPALQLPPATAPPSAPENPAPTPSPSLTSPPAEPQPTAHCQGLEFTEVLSYYASDKSEQFIELYNSTDASINLAGCTLSYKKKPYALAGQIPADDYLAVYPAQLNFSLTKDPSSTNSVELRDADGTLIDLLEYVHGQKKSVAQAKFIAADGSEFWRPTYALTPGKENVLQEFRTCPDGKIINPTSGNCIKVTAPTINSVNSCPAGKVRNPLTGRCKNPDPTTTAPKPCSAGYERNPETNRCRKIKSENDGAGYALVPTTYANNSTFIAFGAVALLVAVGIIYIILQFRHEIARTARKVRQRLYHIRKDLVARGISFRRHK